MLRDNLVELIEPTLNSAGANPLALTHHQIQASGDRLPCLENPRPKGAESSLTENVTSPFQAEPAHLICTVLALIFRMTTALNIFPLHMGAPGGNAISYQSFLHGAALFFLLTIASWCRVAKS